MYPNLYRILRRLSLGAAVLGFCLGVLWPSQAMAANNVQIVSATLGSLSPCAGADDTLTVTLQDLSGATFTPFVYVASQFQSVGCGSGGFDTAASGGAEIFWEVYNGTDPSTPSNLTNEFPSDGGWVAPVSLSYTGQTYTVTFQVQVPGTDDAYSTQDFYIGASSSYQDASGADSYYCLSYGTCMTVGSMVPTNTDSPTPGAASTPTMTQTFTTISTPSASPTPNQLLSQSPSMTQTFTTISTPSASPTPNQLLSQSPSMTQTFTTISTPSASPTPNQLLSQSPSMTQTFTTISTPSASPTPNQLLSQSPPMTQTQTTPGSTPEWKGGCGLTVFPNLIRSSGSVNIVAYACAPGMAQLRIFRQNGRELQQPIREYLGASQKITYTWMGNLADGAEAPSGIYYVVFTENNGRAYVEKVLVVR